MFGKSKFKGKGKTLDDPSPPKRQFPAKTTAQNLNPAPPESPPKPEGPPPGPENRGTVISTRDAYKAADMSKIPDTKDGDLKLSSIDVKGMRVGTGVQPKTFADVNRGKGKAPPTTANIRFHILINKDIVTVEAKFATNESVESLYTYLEQEVFASVSKLEIKNTFPQAVIPRDPSKTLASYKLHGQIILQVTATDAKLK